jgi:hypothetical protein
MPFNADLNPKTKGMDLGDLLKMDDAMTRRKLYRDAMADKSGKTTVIVPVNLKSSADDKGVPFKFGNNYQSED